MENTMPKNVTLDELAAMVARGFEEQGKRMDSFEIELKEFKSEMREFKNEMREFREDTNTSFAKLFNSDAKQNEDIKNLEYRVKQLENARV
jgi:hypothetical protein